MKCKLDNCGKETFEELLYLIEGDKGSVEIELCKSCFTKITGDCAECLINPIDGNEDFSCEQCQVIKADILEDRFDALRKERKEE